MHTFSFAQPKAKLYISRNFSVQSKNKKIIRDETKEICQAIVILNSQTMVIISINCIRSSFNSERIYCILSRNLSRESILPRKTSLQNNAWGQTVPTPVSGKAEKIKGKENYPSACSPLMNSCFENSHMVAAFMCHERTSWYKSIWLLEISQPTPWYARCSL